MLRPATPILALVGLLSLVGSACTQQLELPVARSATGGISGAGGGGNRGGGSGGAGVSGRGGSGGGQGGSGTSSPVDAVSTDVPDAMSAPNKDASLSCNDFDDVRQMLPQVMVTLDRSTSMWKKPDTSTSSRLQIVQRVLKDLMNRYHDTMRFGYVEFPVKECSAGLCCASSVIPPNSSSLSLIDKLWTCQSGAASCTETTDDAPIAQALARSRTYYGNQSAQTAGPGSRHVLLVTDGEPLCAANAEKNDCNLAINEVSTLSGVLKVSTRVIGLTEELRSSTCLENLATLGVPPSAGQMSSGHAIATDGDKLYDEVYKWLSALSKEACMFRLPKVGEAPTVRVRNRERGVYVPQDASHKDGWDLDVPDQPTRITFYGAACERIRDHGAGELSFLICSPP